MQWRNVGWRVPALLGIVTALALFLLLPIRGRNLTAGTEGWTSQGCFEPGAVFVSTFFDPQITAHERSGVTLFGSHCGADAKTGELRSPVFKMPVVLELFTAGYVGDPNQPGLQIFVERESDHTRLSIPASSPHERWVKVDYWTDSDWVGQPVRLVAIDHERGVGGWLGVSNPRRLSLLNYFRLRAKLWAQPIAAYLFQLCLFWLPGFAAACLLKARGREIPTSYLVMVVIGVGSVLGYLSFWAFFVSQGLGLFVTFAAYGCALALLLVLRRKVVSTLVEIREPFQFALLAGLCYISFYFLYGDTNRPGIGYASDRFFVDILPGDNVIPSIFADRIYEHKSVKPFCCGGWLSSDRPPLQAGIVLFERPIATRDNSETGYELLSSAVQCSWICGVWCLLAALRIEAKTRRRIIGFLIFSGFLFYNSVYTWPKLLAAAFILFVLSLLFELRREQRPVTAFETVLGASSLGLALMAHPGSTFSLAVFAVLLWQLRRLVPLRQAVMVLVMVLAFYMPWSLYQKYVDPPGNRLLKMHLAGVMGIDSRTTLEAIRDAYTSHSLREIVDYKWLNVVYLAGTDFFDPYGLNATDHAHKEHSRNMQRFFMWNAMGLVNVGWLAVLFLLIRKRMPPWAGWLLVAGLGNLLFWSLITFGPYETQTAHSSYADILLISVALLQCILALPRPVYYLLLAWQLWNFVVVWVWSAPGRIPLPITVQWPMLIAGAVFALWILWVTLKNGSEVEEPVIESTGTPILLGKTVGGAGEVQI